MLDIFAGSATTGAASETLGRRWLGFELERDYIATSAFRFLNVCNADMVRKTYTAIANGASGHTLPGVPLPVEPKTNGKRALLLGTPTEVSELGLFAH